MDLHGVYFFDAVDGKKENLQSPITRLTKGMLGCYQSHLNILKDAIANNFNRILVFEDDLKPQPGVFGAVLEWALPSIPPDWQFVYLGCQEYAGFGTHKRKVSDFWVVPNSAWGTQAFMISGRDSILTMLIQLKQITAQVDESISRVLPVSGLNYYSIFPSIVSQAFDELGTDVQDK